MAKYVELNADNEERLCAVAKALDSPVRIQIIKELFKHSLNINEISENIKIPASSAALHVKILEQAELIRTENQPGERGSMKLCSIKADFITIRLNPRDKKQSILHKISMPVGMFTDCDIYPTCGLATKTGFVGNEDIKECFYLPERSEAQLIWSSGGFVEYTFPNDIFDETKITKISFSLEICSEAPNYREDWKSDLTVWINNIDCGTWQSPGDLGARRGLLTPLWIESGSTQYGLLTTWEIKDSGSYINGQKVHETNLKDLKLSKKSTIRFRIGNKPDAKYCGGFNIFGKLCGDYPQDIIMSIE
ncbi:MAG: helix-turn-helix domain-containing protein [Spirochaetales bacterium]